MKDDRWYRVGMASYILSGLIILMIGFLLEGDEMIAVLVTGAIILVSAIILHVILRNRSTNVMLEGGVLSISGMFMSEEIKVSSVRSISLRNDVHYKSYGRRWYGYGGLKILAGDFENEEFGNYSISVDIRDASDIVILHGGGYVVFNMGDALETQRVFSTISKECKHVRD